MSPILRGSLAALVFASAAFAETPEPALDHQALEAAGLRPVEGAVSEEAPTVVLQGATIFTDVEMVKAGVSKVRAASFGCKVECRLNDPKVVDEARRRELTRSAIGVERAVSQDPEGIFVFGNAPTALFRLLELVDEGVAKPKLIIGVVVGFVGAAESKDALMQRTDVNWISCKGNKGGSNVAAAAVNALFKAAAGEV